MKKTENTFKRKIYFENYVTDGWLIVMCHGISSSLLSFCWENTFYKWCPGADLSCIYRNASCHLGLSLSPFSCYVSFFLSLWDPAGLISRGWDVVKDINQLSLPTPLYSVLLSVSIFMTLSTVFHSINSPDSSPFSHSSSSSSSSNSRSNHNVEVEAGIQRCFARRSFNNWPSLTYRRT